MTKHRWIFAEPLSSLELSARASNALDREGISLVGDLVTKTRSELLKIHNLGRTTVDRIESVLSAEGLTLGMKPTGFADVLADGEIREAWAALEAAYATFKHILLKKNSR
jgi:DNA-directed RNA polymerase alpha subunit